ncbi:MAG: thiol:disulfide interchange protein DsbA/DsbL [Gammaproteobacteria bacterium]|nr:thiol:disulfide interchange protein DsbA/DsbL [Gammaproteobacteria bacterium]MCY4218185.1 thiol:disulfide interchange protein DsbA/DsbL [Gammaproteobacteria bacterium]
MSILILTDYALSQSSQPEEAFIKDGHYIELDQVQPVQTGDKIEVLEVFWYECPHCYRLHPVINEWLKNKPETAEYVPMPVYFNPERNEFSARAFYTFEVLDKLDPLHSMMFHAIHDERRSLRTKENLATWAEEFGVSGQDIINTFDSFAIDSKINFSKVMTRQYGITGVPTIIIDGRYMTSVSHAGNHENLIDVMNFLIEKARQVRLELGK